MRKNKKDALNQPDSNGLHSPPGIMVKDENPFTRKKFLDLISNIFFITLIIGICFAILYPILTLLPMVFTDLRELGSPDAIWIPSKFSVNSIEFVFRSVMKGDAMIMVKSILYAFSICLIQVFMSAMAGYSLARTEFKGRNLVFFLVVFVFLVPRQSFLITQYLHLKP